jgi:hypoxanthine phosphoribosyltransferase
LFQSDILQYTHMSALKYYKISWEQLHKDCIETAKKIQGKIDKIIAISRGGLVTARILSDIINAPISHITITSYQNLQQETEPFIEETPNRTFHHETILIVDDLSDTGKTFKRAIQYFQNFHVKRIYTLSPYIKPETAFIPDFYIKSLDGWVIFPYEIQETKKAFMHKLKNEADTIKELTKIGYEEWEL